MSEAAAQAGSDVMQTAREQGREVAAETGRQVHGLYQRATSELTDQASQQQKRIANGLYALSDEAHRMAQASGDSGPMTQLAREAAERIRTTGQWLEAREPGDVVREVQSYARQHPGTFLAGAAVLGIIAGRLTKNLSHPSDDQRSHEQRSYGQRSDDQRSYGHRSPEPGLGYPT